MLLCQDIDTADLCLPRMILRYIINVRAHIYLATRGMSEGYHVTFGFSKNQQKF